VALALRPIARALALGLVLVGAPAAAAAPDLAGYPNPRVVLSEDASGAVLWWDATPWVGRLIDDNTPRDAALKALEFEAVKLFVTRAPVLPTHAAHLRVVVVFAKSGLVSGPYKTNASEGVRTLLVAEGNVRAHMTFAPGWEADAKHGVFPAGVAVTPSADLPAMPTSSDGAQ
jgi:hypothetical protein